MYMAKAWHLYVVELFFFRFDSVLELESALEAADINV